VLCVCCGLWAVGCVWGVGFAVAAKSHFSIGFKPCLPALCIDSALLVLVGLRVYYC
jgi:hypothetical protein